MIEAKDIKPGDRLILLNASDCLTGLFEGCLFMAMPDEEGFSDRGNGYIRGGFLRIEAGNEPIISGNFDQLTKIKNWCFFDYVKFRKSEEGEVGRKFNG